MKKLKLIYMCVCVCVEFVCLCVSFWFSLCPRVCVVECKRNAFCIFFDI